MRIFAHGRRTHFGYLLKRKLLSNPRCARLGVCRRVGLLPEPGVGERPRESGEGPTSGACLTGCTPDGAPVTWCSGLALVRALSGAPLGLPAGMAAVQQKSTATGADAGGLAGTPEDGDLHG